MIDFGGGVPMSVTLGFVCANAALHKVNSINSALAYLVIDAVPNMFSPRSRLCIFACLRAKVWTKQIPYA
jgi:hypothetical protein